MPVIDEIQPNQLKNNDHERILEEEKESIHLNPKLMYNNEKDKEKLYELFQLKGLFSI